jgi:hypothetical protein
MEGVMKKLFLIIIPILYFISCASEGTPSNPGTSYPISVEIRIYGSDNLQYTGSFGNTNDTTSVNGAVPPGNQNYNLYNETVENDSDFVWASFTKQQEVGGLRVSIYVEEHLEASQETYDPFSSVYVTWTPD